MNIMTAWNVLYGKNVSDCTCYHRKDRNGLCKYKEQNEIAGMRGQGS
jgi:hypothetical protein